jgi:hypothetical protein
VLLIYYALSIFDKISSIILPVPNVYRTCARGYFIEILYSLTPASLVAKVKLCKFEVNLVEN